MTMLFGGPAFAYATADDPEAGVLLRRDEQRGVILALPVPHDRQRRDTPLMTTPLAELNLGDSHWNRALCAWAAWLAWTLMSKNNKVVN